MFRSDFIHGFVRRKTTPAPTEAPAQFDVSILVWLPSQIDLSLQWTWCLRIACPPYFYSVFGWFAWNILTRRTVSSEGNQFFIHGDVRSRNAELWKLSHKQLPNVSESSQFVGCSSVFPGCLIIKTKKPQNSHETIYGHCCSKDWPSMFAGPLVTQRLQFGSVGSSQ